MLYCSLEEAWGNTPKKSKIEHFGNTSNDNYDRKPIPETSDDEIIDEVIEQKIKGVNQNEKLYDEVTPPTKEKPKIKIIEKERKITCKDVFAHIIRCKKCRKKLRHYFRENDSILDNYLSKENKDTLVLILTGLAIVLIVHMLIK